ncbi:hypothetical protein [Haloechinothrix sp. LS1_15]|uniref:hypothetical protein n=1 Tax=Haloechinothrix sp. LS1_15 TaxID=2652248 RepID=UPI0029489F6B|nr:hypothetical protein [Haloechinothrix sp. LS1_15]MDV6011672.1 hypothetical protein [Haloechinothrix sp. LS1_15]
MSEGGHGVDADELRALKSTLDDASDSLGMKNFAEEASLEGFLTTQSGVSPYENVDETVEETVLALTEFVDQNYPAAVDAMHDFIVRTHVTITNLADGVAQAGEDYEITEDQITEWLEDHDIS